MLLIYTDMSTHFSIHVPDILQTCLGPDMFQSKYVPDMYQTCLNISRHALSMSDTCLVHILTGECLVSNMSKVRSISRTCLNKSRHASSMIQKCSTHIHACSIHFLNIFRQDHTCSRYVCTSSQHIHTHLKTRKQPSTGARRRGM